MGILALLARTAVGADGLQPRPVPKYQAVPQPEHQISFRREGHELTRLHYGPALRRPFLFPVIGPSGRELTRLGHPHDPEGHSHHNSVWISHHDVNGVDFWGDRGAGRIVHRRIIKLEDGDQRAAAVTENEWLDGDGRPLLRETRTIGVEATSTEGWLLTVAFRLLAVVDVEFGRTPFGFVGVRVAKSMGVNDGGGRILNSEGGVNEAEVFWKRARWVDYSGAVAIGEVEGLSLMDHADNPNHPAVFHVRNDGWMGASFSHASPVKLPKGATLELRYGVFVHGESPSGEVLETAWQSFSGRRE